ncbi:MAG: N-acetyl-gamma-glutamyl-phosphate reductase [Desulfobulbaceae bacterium]|nr:N-acetyl-gamma-glutamyl-phosphate reductase [Desulfobulbaceae bacterium]HIJ78725.1 N-acetyl-gamma-glutamyl-phosphate reductase [Deltaproteobacteria bacterium]
MIRVGIVGASGYTGAELARILCNHPEVELTVATSRQYAGKKLSSVFPSLKGRVDIVCEDVQLDALVDRADLFFTAVPHQTAMAIVPQLLAAGKKVIDLSADYRIHDAKVYEQWYQAHSSQELLAEAVYGLPEIHRSKIKNARLVANPGCYPTSVILGLAPLLKAGLIDPATIIIDSKSGTSGAGRAAQVSTLFCEVADGFKAYKVGEHRHTPEIEQELGELCDSQVLVTFTPHLVPMSRGILSTIYAKTNKALTGAELEKLYGSFYENERFVRVLDNGQFPATQYIRGSNFCDIGYKYDQRTGRVIIVSAIDNVVKGASGQAVQNMNIISELPEEMGLNVVPLFP